MPANNFKMSTLKEIRREGDRKIIAKCCQNSVTSITHKSEFQEPKAQEIGENYTKSHHNQSFLKQWQKL